jgi:hypothetical protein
MAPDHRLTFGPFRLEMPQGCLWRGDQMLALRPRSLPWHRGEKNGTSTAFKLSKTWWSSISHPWLRGHFEGTDRRDSLNVGGYAWTTGTPKTPGSKKSDAVYGSPRHVGWY